MTDAKRVTQIGPGTLEALIGVIDASPLAIVTTDPEGTVNGWNPAAETILGWTADEVLGRPYPAIPNVREGMYLDVRERVVKDGLSFSGVETVRMRKDGTIFDAAVSAAPIRGSGGEIVGVLALIEDISERKRSERAHREMEERLRTLAIALEASRALAEEQRERLYSLFMQTPAHVAIARGPQHVYEFANDQYVRALGNRDFIGRPVAEVLPEIVSQGIIPIADRVFETGEPFVGTEVPQRFDYDGDGEMELQYFNVVMQPLRDPDGPVTGIMLLSFEVTEQVLARRTVEAAAREREAILGQIADGVVIADRTGQITFMNEAACRIYGVSPLGVGIDMYVEAFHLQQADGATIAAESLPMYRAVMGGETVTNHELRVRRPDGSQVVIQASAAPILAPDGASLGGVLTVRDVTAQYDLARQKDDFLSAAAHDLKTPLTSIKGYTQILERRARRANTSETNALLDGLSRIDETTKKMTQLINELLDITRIQMGRPLDLVQRRLDLAALLRALVKERGEAGADRVSFDSSPAEVWGTWDAYRLERVFGNILTNAIKYSPEGGPICVTVQQDEGVAMVTVRDSGIGIPARDLPRIFERFFRGSNVGERISGTGIGLAAAREIVSQHAGTITVESVEGEGTTVRVCLPRTEEE
jgi:PAS domain S-box-containing protein